MKKILLVIILLVGCSKPTLYDTYVNDLKKANESVFPFDVNFYIDEVNEERLIYQVIIDNPQIEASEVLALVIHDGKTEDIFPSVGIVDDKVNLKEEKGIILIGYVQKEEEIKFKVLVETNNNQYIYEYKY